MRLLRRSVVSTVFPHSHLLRTEWRHTSPQWSGCNFRGGVLILSTGFVMSRAHHLFLAHGAVASDSLPYRRPKGCEYIRKKSDRWTGSARAVASVSIQTSKRCWFLAGELNRIEANWRVSESPDRRPTGWPINEQGTPRPSTLQTLQSSGASTGAPEDKSRLRGGSLEGTARLQARLARRHSKHP